MRRKGIASSLPVIIAWLLSFVVIIPLLVVLMNTMKTSLEAAKFNLALPADFLGFKNYYEVMKGSNIGRSFINSMIMSLFPTIINVVLAAMAAFIISRDRSRLNRGIYYYFVFGLMAPLNYVPTTMVLKWLHLSGTYTGIILLLAAAGIPFALFLFYGFISSISRTIDEAAIIDGCGPIRLFYQVIFPLLLPVTVTGFILNFLGCWNDFKTPLYVLNSSENWGMIMNMYSYFGLKSQEWNLVCTVIVLTMLPVVIMYIFGQKYIIEGMTSGAVKG